jgi:hypothetical protein
LGLAQGRLLFERVQARLEARDDGGKARLGLAFEAWDAIARGHP